MSTKPLARTAVSMMFLIFVSRLLGFVRLRAASEVFGRTWHTDAFNAAFVIPDLMYYLLVGGALSSAFIPVFTSYLAKGEEAEGWNLASSFLNLTFLGLVAFSLLGMAFSPQLAPLVAYNFTGEQRELLIYLMRIMFPAVFLTALSGLAVGVLNSYQRFILPVMGPILYNIGIILGAYLLGPRMGIVGMAVGTVAGAAANFSLQLVQLRRWRSNYRLTINWHHPGMRRIFALMGPAVISLSIAQINLIISQNLASGLAKGTITALGLANRLMQFPLGVFAMGISQVIFPTMTRQAAVEDWPTLRHTFSRGLRSIFYITIPSAIGLLALGEPIVRLLFQAGEFGPDDTAATAYALLFYAPGLVALSGTQLLTRIYYSLQDTRTPVKVGIQAVIINTILSLGFLKFTSLDSGGLALAYSITNIVNMTSYILRLRKKLGTIDGRRILTCIVKASAAASAMGLVVYQLTEFIGSRIDLAAAAGRIFQVIVPMGAGAVIYFALTLVLRMEELKFVGEMFRRRR
ncbi:MAG: murein biosynthesis integral membrane protein MurJ [Firmicutes bacterium]|mgnify:CR=1 FL=1|jgi:putative peptidoglycan lipid II flippase|nr:murein biosynthesis integral membrane protein MurJ [Bacillota bacterium]